MEKALVDLSADEPKRLCGNCMSFGSCLCKNGEAWAIIEKGNNILDACDLYLPVIQQIEAEKRFGIEHYEE